VLGTVFCSLSLAEKEELKNNTLLTGEGLGTVFCSLSLAEKEELKNNPLPTSPLTGGGAEEQHPPDR
jgi:hypothetical protein